MSGFTRSGGNKRNHLRPTKKAKDKAKLAKNLASGHHIDERMTWGIADMKRMFPEVCAVPKVCTIVEARDGGNARGGPFLFNVRGVILGC